MWSSGGSGLSVPRPPRGRLVSRLLVYFCPRERLRPGRHAVRLCQIDKEGPDGHGDGQMKGGKGRRKARDTDLRATSLRRVRPEPPPKIRRQLAIDTRVGCDRGHSEFSSDQIAMWSTAVLI